MAASSPYGIVLAISEADFQLVQQRLYSVRRKLNDPALALLQFRRSPYGVSNELWIVKQSSPPQSTPDQSIALTAPTNPTNISLLTVDFSTLSIPNESSLHGSTE
jgi:hypothetical protein